MKIDSYQIKEPINFQLKQLQDQINIINGLLALLMIMHHVCKSQVILAVKGLSMSSMAAIV